MRITVEQHFLGSLKRQLVGHLFELVVEIHAVGRYSAGLLVFVHVFGKVAESVFASLECEQLVVDKGETVLENPLTVENSFVDSVDECAVFVGGLVSRHGFDAV